MRDFVSRDIWRHRKGKLVGSDERVILCKQEIELVFPWTACESRRDVKSCVRLRKFEILTSMAAHSARHENEHNGQ